MKLVGDTGERERGSGERGNEGGGGREGERESERGNKGGGGREGERERGETFETGAKVSQSGQGYFIQKT